MITQTLLDNKAHKAILRGVNARKIEFRAWNKNKKEMVDVYNMDFTFVEDFSVEKIEVSKTDDFSEYPFYKIDNPDDFIIMQNTGLKDKNGKEIYEGDIVKFYCKGLKRYFNKRVRFWNGGFVVGEQWLGGEIDEINKKSRRYYKKLKVIGNIYENFELLK